MKLNNLHVDEFLEQLIQPIFFPRKLLHKYFKITIVSLTSIQLYISSDLFPLYSFHRIFRISLSPYLMKYLLLYIRFTTKICRIYWFFPYVVTYRLLENFIVYSESMRYWELDNVNGKSINGCQSIDRTDKWLEFAKGCF